MPDFEPPLVKLVLAAGQDPWTGLIYPTKTNRGEKRPFNSPGDVLAAVADLLRWEVPAARPESVGSDEQRGRQTSCCPEGIRVSDLQGPHLSPEQKLAFVLRVLHGELSLVDASRSAGASVQAVAEWRQAVLVASLLALGQASDGSLLSRIDALVDEIRTPSKDGG